MTVHQRRAFLVSCMILSAVLFVITGLNFRQTLMLNFGEWIQSYLYDFLGSFGDLMFVVITYIGSAYVSFPVMGILICIFLFQKRYWTTLLLVFNLVGVRQVNWLLKSIFERSRPELEHLVQVNSASFPSGHAMNSIAFFGLLAYWLYLILKDARKSYYWVWASAIILIGLIGISRVYLGVHYPLDVIGGFLAGGTWLLLTTFLYTYVPKKESFA